MNLLIVNIKWLFLVLCSISLPSCVLVSPKSLNSLEFSTNGRNISNIRVTTSRTYKKILAFHGASNYGGKSHSYFVNSEERFMLDPVFFEVPNYLSQGARYFHPRVKSFITNNNKINTIFWEDILLQEKKIKATELVSHLSTLTLYYSKLSNQVNTKQLNKIITSDIPLFEKLLNHIDMEPLNYTFYTRSINKKWNFDTYMIKRYQYLKKIKQSISRSKSLISEIRKKIIS